MLLDVSWVPITTSIPPAAITSSVRAMSHGDPPLEPVMLNDGDAMRFGSVDAHYISEVAPEVTEELPPEQNLERKFEVAL